MNSLRTKLLPLAGLAGLLLPCQAPVQAQEPGEEASAGTRWFEASVLDLGRHLEGEVAKGDFEFRNPHDIAHEFRGFQPSCTCSKVLVHVGDEEYAVENTPRPNTIYRITGGDGEKSREQVDAVTIGPGQEGRIEMQIDLRGVVGPKEATVTVRTSDPDAPNVILKARAHAMQFFRLVPPEVNLNEMKWSDQRRFTVQITSPLQPEFEITGHDPLPEKMEVEYRKEMRDGTAVWHVEGTYGPNVDPSAGGGIIQLHTDVDGRRVPVRVMAWVQGPLEIRPSTFVPFGRIRKGEEVRKVVEFEATDDYDLEIEKVELLNLSVDDELVTTTVEKDGKVCKLAIVISKDVPRRLVRGDVVVHLNHPAAKRKELQFNGFVR